MGYTERDVEKRIEKLVNEKIYDENMDGVYDEGDEFIFYRENSGFSSGEAFSISYENLREKAIEELDDECEDDEYYIEDY